MNVDNCGDCDKKSDVGPDRWGEVEAQSCPFQLSYPLSQVSAQVVLWCVGGRRELLTSTI